MKTVVANDNPSLDEVLRDVERDEDVLIVRDGHVVALLTAFDDEDAEWYGRERDPSFIASIAEARRQIRDGRSVGH